jgi:hypothetical protein
MIFRGPPAWHAEGIDRCKTDILTNLGIGRDVVVNPSADDRHTAEYGSGYGVHPFERVAQRVDGAVNCQAARRRSLEDRDLSGDLLDQVGPNLRPFADAVPGPASVGGDGVEEIADLVQVDLDIGARSHSVANAHSLADRDFISQCTPQRDLDSRKST